jgi:hypothetical protein
MEGACDKRKERTLGAGPNGRLKINMEQREQAALLRLQGRRDIDESPDLRDQRLVT